MMDDHVRRKTMNLNSIVDHRTLEQRSLEWVLENVHFHGIMINIDFSAREYVDQNIDDAFDTV